MLPLKENWTECTQPLSEDFEKQSVAGRLGKTRISSTTKMVISVAFFFFLASSGLSTMQHPKGNTELQTGFHESPSSGFTRGGRELPNAWSQSGKLPCLPFISSLGFIPSSPPFPSNAMVAGTKTAPGSIRDQK